MWQLWEEGPQGSRMPEPKEIGWCTFHDEWMPVLQGEPLPPRRRALTPIQLEQAKLQASAWLQQNIIEPIPDPPLLNNLVMVAKKDGRIRVCIDCTPANRVTQSFDWPLPRLQDLRYFVSGAKYFSRIDLKDAFFRISIPVEFRHLTAFKVGSQSYRFRRMPFGLKTAPAVFQRFMDEGLAHLSHVAFWYMDDIIIKAETIASLRQREASIRKELKKMGSEVNEGKSVSCRSELLMAGLWISPAGVGPNFDKLSELLKLPAPSTKADAQSALGLVSYLRDFTPLVGHFTAMLYPDKSGLKLETGEYCNQWELLRRHLKVAATTTHHWKDNTDADLYTDASGYALGAILLQAGKVVSLASRKLTPAETRYSATDREHLGLYFAADKFRMFLHQSNATTRVWSDHAALVTRKPDKLTPRQARWHMHVSHWMPNVMHVPGKLNPADFISRWKIGGLGANL